MYRAYLVDDDRFTLEELTEIIPWMENGFDYAPEPVDKGTEVTLRLPLIKA